MFGLPCLYAVSLSSKRTLLAASWTAWFALLLVRDSSSIALALSFILAFPLQFFAMIHNEFAAHSFSMIPPLPMRETSSATTSRSSIVSRFFSLKSKLPRPTAISWADQVEPSDIPHRFGWSKALRNIPRIWLNTWNNKQRRFLLHYI